MESRFKQKVAKAVSLITVIVFISASVSQAQNIVPEKMKEKGVVNLLAGMKSDNSGLKRSCIYLAGKYKLTEAINILAEQLKKVEDANTRLLIALSLYQIGSEESFAVIRKAAINDDDAKVRKVCTEIYNAFVENNYTASAKDILN